MREMAALLFILVLATGTAWADWDSTWGNDGVEQKTGTKTGSPPAVDADGQKPAEPIARERSRDENAPPEIQIPAEAPPQPDENSGSQQ